MKGEATIFFRRLNFNFQRIVLLLGVLFLLSHCSTKGQIQKVDEREVLRKRASEYWQYQIDGKIDLAYQHEAPLYREQFPISNYIGRFRLITYTEANVNDVKISGGEAKVNVTVKYKLMARQFKKIDTVKAIEENWVRIDHVWYHLPEGFEMTKK